MFTQRTLTTEELRHWLAVWLAPGIGPSAFLKLLKHCGNFENLPAQPEKILSKKISAETLDGLKKPSWKNIEKELAFAEENHHHIIPFVDPRYPNYLREIAASPPLLFVQGDVDCLASPQIAIVGSRKPSNEGREIARQFAHALSEHGFVITSGLAVGVDAASHESALSANGKTIAVMATGLNRIYPASHRNLAERIQAQGAIISELPYNISAKPEYFPRRNRIISGLSRGVLVVEAALKSGSLITARYAIEQNREIFAIPGSLHNAMAAGCHRLIQQGAKLVTCVEDILEEFPDIVREDKTISKTSATPIHDAFEHLDSEQKKLLSYLSPEPISIDLLIERSKLGAHYVASTLLMLELQGCVQSTHRGYIKPQFS